VILSDKLSIAGHKRCGQPFAIASTSKQAEQVHRTLQETPVISTAARETTYS